MVFIKSDDIFNLSEQVLGHQTNCQGVVGGLAGLVFKKFPETYSTYKSVCCVPIEKSLFGKTQLVKTNKGFYIANIFGQFNPGPGTDYTALSSALIDLKRQMVKKGLKTLALPYRIGAGIGGGDWNKIQSILIKIFQDPAVNLTLYKKD